jgi:hypothetical protein
MQRPERSPFDLELVTEVRDSVFQSQSDWSLLPTAPLVPNFVGSVDAPPRGSSVVIIFVMPASQVGFEERSNGGEVRRKKARFDALLAVLLLKRHRSSKSLGPASILLRNPRVLGLKQPSKSYYTVWKYST